MNTYDDYCLAPVSQTAKQAISYLREAEERIWAKEYNRGLERQPWTVVPAAKLVRVWSDAMGYGFVRDEEALGEVVDQILINVVRLWINSDLLTGSTGEAMAKATSMGVRLEGPNVWDRLREYAQDRYTDFALCKLLPKSAQLLVATDPMERLSLADQILNVTHSRYDLAELFVEGGSSTLDQLSARRNPSRAPLDPDDVTKYDRTDEELQEFILFSAAVTGADSHQRAKALHCFLSGRGAKTPFQWIMHLYHTEGSARMMARMKRCGLGQQLRLLDLFVPIASCGLDLRDCPIEALEYFKGIGPKTARFYLLHSRPGQKRAALDRHILEGLRAHGVRSPRSTPTNPKEYARLEREFLRIAAEKGMPPEELDLMWWKEGSGGSERRPNPGLTPYQKRIAWVFKNYRHEPAVGIYTHRMMVNMVHRGEMASWGRDALQPMTEGAVQGYTADAVAYNLDMRGFEAYLPMIPWIASVIYNAVKRLRQVRVSNRFFDADEAFFCELRTMMVEMSHILDWVQATHPDIMSMTWVQAFDAANVWHNALRMEQLKAEEEARNRVPRRGQVVFQFDDGWTVQRLTSKEQLKEEGLSMGHCVGLSSTYYNQVTAGKAMILSLRREDGRPEVSIQLMPTARARSPRPASSGQPEFWQVWVVGQAKGKRNKLITWDEDEQACTHLLRFFEAVDPDSPWFDPQVPGIMVEGWRAAYDMVNCVSSPYMRLRP